jgi:hypothetical protein
VRADVVSSPAPNPYVDDSPLPVDAAGAFLASERRRRLYYTPDTYQIISAGADGLYGLGGQFTRKADEPLPFYAVANKTITGQALTKTVRLRERDNVTNFAQNKLD